MIYNYILYCTCIDCIYVKYLEITTHDKHDKQERDTGAKLTAGFPSSGLQNSSLSVRFCVHDNCTGRSMAVPLKEKPNLAKLDYLDFRFLNAR